MLATIYTLPERSIKIAIMEKDREGSPKIKNRWSRIFHAGYIPIRKVGTTWVSFSWWPDKRTVIHNRILVSFDICDNMDQTAWSHSWGI